MTGLPRICRTKNTLCRNPDALVRRLVQNCMRTCHWALTYSEDAPENNDATLHAGVCYRPRPANIGACLPKASTTWSSGAQFG